MSGDARENNDPGSSVADRIERFENELIPHPTHKQALAAVRALHSRWRPWQSDKRPRARALLIIGESGAGKSSVLEKYWEEFPEIRLEDVVDGMLGGYPVKEELLERLRDANFKPLVMVELTRRMTERQFVGALFGALGYRDRREWNQANVIKKISEYVNDLGVQVILIDEGHNMANFRDGTSELIEFLKSLLNQIGVPIVVAGLPGLLKIQNYDGDRQMGRRLQPAIHLVPYDWWTVQGRTRFLALLARFEAKLELRDNSGLKQHATAARIYVATAGEVGWISKYLSLCLERALTRGLHKVDLTLLAEVHESLERRYAGPDRLLGFNELIDVKEEEAEAGWKSADPSANPFLCAFDALPAMWEQRKAVLRLRPERRRRADPCEGSGPEPDDRTDGEGKAAPESIRTPLMALPLRLRHREGEPAHGTMVRLAARHRDADVFRFAQSYGCPMRDLLAGRLVLRVGLMAGVDPERLAVHSPRLDVPRRVVTLAGEVLLLNDWSIRRRRWCPACLRDDRLDLSAPAGSSCWHRSAWDVGSVTSCPLHRIALAERCPECGSPQDWRGRRSTGAVAGVT